MMFHCSVHIHLNLTVKIDIEDIRKNIATVLVEMVDTRNLKTERSVKMGKFSRPAVLSL